MATSPSRHPPTTTIDIILYLWNDVYNNYDNIVSIYVFTLQYTLNRVAR